MVDVPLDAALSTEMIIVKPIRVPMAHYTIDPNSYFHKTSSPVKSFSRFILVDISSSSS